MSILKQPVITEKSLSDARRGWFTFIVDRDANKPAIKGAVEEQFGVKVLQVQTSIKKGHTKRVGKRRVEIVVAPSKKARVHLAENQKIDLFEIPAS